MTVRIASAPGPTVLLVQSDRDRAPRGRSRRTIGARPTQSRATLGVESVLLPADLQQILLDLVALVLGRLERRGHRVPQVAYGVGLGHDGLRDRPHALDLGVNHGRHESVAVGRAERIDFVQAVKPLEAFPGPKLRLQPHAERQEAGLLRIGLVHIGIHLQDAFHAPRELLTRLVRVNPRRRRADAALDIVDAATHGAPPSRRPARPVPRARP